MPLVTDPSVKVCHVTSVSASWSEPALGDRVWDQPLAQWHGGWHGIDPNSEIMFATIAVIVAGKVRTLNQHARGEDIAVTVWLDDVCPVHLEVEA